MNKCPNCNAEVQTTDKFCMNCGSPIEPESKELIVSEKSVQASSDKRPIIIAAVVIALLVLIGVLSTQSRAETINIEDYIISDDEVQYAGMNGSAYLITEKQDFLYADWLYCDMAGIDRNSSSQSVDSFYEYIAENSQIEFAGLVEPLTNGDSFKVIWTPDYDAINTFQDFEKEVSGPETFEYEFMVEGLGETESVDPFSVIDEIACFDSTYNTSFHITYNSFGLSNKNYEFRPEEDEWSTWNLYDSNTDEWISSFHISSSSYSTIHPGDSLTLELDCSSDSFDSYGFHFTRTKAVYPVKALIYVTNKDVFDYWDWVKFNEKLESYLNDTDQPVALYFDLPKDPAASPKNSLEVVVKQEDTYQCYYVDDILQNENGEVRWSDSNERQPVKTGRWFKSENEYKDYFSNHEGDTVIAYDISKLLE